MNFEGITIIERDFDNIVFDKLMKVKFVDSGQLDEIQEFWKDF